jgi:Ca-activated chloride channel family protein
VLVTLAALALVVLALRWVSRRRHERLATFVEAKLASRLVLGADAALRRPLSWFTFLGFLFLAVTFAQPHWGRAWQEVHQRSRDIIVCLDTSESMRAENPLPNRLGRSKQKIRSLMDLARGDRFGLIAFSGGAALQCPLTLDHGYFRSVLNAVDTDTISMEGTDIAAALREAAALFREDEVGSSRNNRAILLISDGEQVVGDVVEAAEEVSELARVFVIGVGHPEGVEVEYPQWMVPHAEGRRKIEPHLSKLDEETLKRVAAAGSGAYTRAQADNWDIEQIFENLEVLATRDVGSDVRLRMVNRYQWPLLLALACFAAEGVWLVLMPWFRRWRVLVSPGPQGVRGNV